MAWEGAVSQKPPGSVLDHDVFTLTTKGTREVRDSETSLSTAQLDLLVRIDGVLSVGEIAASMSGRSPRTIVDGFEKLMRQAYIAHAPKPESDSLDFTNFFAVREHLEPGGSELKRATRQVVAGVASLRRDGYFVRIARRRAARGGARSGKLSALVIEDEPTLAKFLKHFLALEGFASRTAGNRGEILAALRQPPVPDFMLLDVVLPDADGFDVLARMRQHPALERVPVVMLTAKATREAVLKGLALGADGYITKPFEVDALSKAVQTVLGRPNK